MCTDLISENLHFQNLFLKLLSVYFILSQRRHLQYIELQYIK